MCDTVMRPTSYTGETINNFLLRSLFPSPSNIRKKPKLTVETAQRLMGHISPDWIDGEVYQELDELQCAEEGREPIDRVVAPTFRGIEDFRGCGSVITRLATADSRSRLWNRFPAMVDEQSERVVIAVDDLIRVEVDPRHPALWTPEEYDLIMNRPKPGSGYNDRIADVATASILLSGFTEHPHVPPTHITGTLRNFVLMGR